jgi:hypothetical protein
MVDADLTDPDYAERVRTHLELRIRGMSLRKIAEHTGWSAATVHRDIAEALVAQIREPAEVFRQYELERLDKMQQAAVAVLEATHLVVSNGKVVYFNGEPLWDPQPVLNAVRTLLDVMVRRSKLLGLDSPDRAEIQVAQVDAEDLELNDLINAERARNAAEEARLKGEPAEGAQSTADFDAEQEGSTDA